MPILAITESGPLIECSICGRQECDYETGVTCDCGAVHCSKCLREAGRRGDYVPDCDSGRNISTFRRCAKCVNEEAA